MDEGDTSTLSVTHDDTCHICTNLLYNPVRTECNHVFCGFCMAQWSDTSRSMTQPLTRASALDDLNLTDFDPTFTAVDEYTSIEASCPVCRRQTSATLDQELARELEERHAGRYAERREDESQRLREGEEEGAESMVLLFGNKHRELRTREEEGRQNSHEWTFFVRASRPEIIKEIRVNLHPTFPRPREILTTPPFEIRRRGWGTFRIDFTIILKPPYVWTSPAPATASEPNFLKLDWTLSFDDRGAQNRLRTKIKKVDVDMDEETESDDDDFVPGDEDDSSSESDDDNDDETYQEESSRVSPVAWPHMEAGDA
ncbi:hypothetical protein BDV96DRAFT_254338 [Lophiotrema nucula]|uniref:Protein AF-9 homolog n=1 Tax=Lophiotrema nucula TaxID=690887 RepID=A0A6A5YRW7_9PLEO|nr:hypothetical protein BDV96DRAFT_254338 [Lophiotrema nucula]